MCGFRVSVGGEGQLTKQQRGERRSRGSGRTRRVDRFALWRTKRLREARRTEEVRRAAQASAAGVVGAARRGTTAGQRAWFICTVLMTSHEAMRRTYASGSTRRPHMEHVSNDNGRSSGSAVLRRYMYVPKIETALTRDQHIRPPHTAQIVNDCYAKDCVEHIKPLN